MLDQDFVAVSPATVYRVLSTAGRLDRWNRKPSRKGTGFEQPDGPHRHWHVDNGGPTPTHALLPGSCVGTTARRSPVWEVCAGAELQPGVFCRHARTDDEPAPPLVELAPTLSDSATESLQPVASKRSAVHVHAGLYRESRDHPRLRPSP